MSKWLRDRVRMIKRKLQDLTVCCSYQVDFLHQKEHSAKEFKKRYEVLDEIGRGGFGIVYKAVRISDGKPVAVKYIQHKLVREWTLTCKQLIPSEVCYLEMCKDVPGVIELMDWFANSKGFLVVMERPENCVDVFDLVNTYGGLDEDIARSIFKQVVETVCGMYAKHGLIHRDIKDENLIINMNTGEVRLVDFGATSFLDKAMKKEFQGTRSYCPPEWFRQLQYLPLEATSWSLGVLLFILVTGHLPFRNEIQVCLSSVKFPSYLSKEVCQLIKSCLTSSTQARATLVQIAEHPWMCHPIATYAESFESVLNARKNEKLSALREEEDEEERDLNDVVLTSQQQQQQQPEDDDQSIYTMCTAVEEPDQLSTLESTALTRSASKYDNVSASSFADYVSMVSNTTADTSDFYHSANDLSASSSSIGYRIPSLANVKSASAYNLASRRKKSIFKSFDTELDPVDELEQNMDNLALCPTLTASTSSSSSADDTTMCEVAASAKASTSDVIDDHDDARAALVARQLSRISRQRPLRFCDLAPPAPPSLAVFEVSPSCR